MEAYSLGFGEPIPISAEHGIGMPDVYDAIRRRDAATEEAAEEPEAAEDDEEAAAEAKPLQIAIIGQPNAGKSTLVNRLIGEERMLTGPEAGITRDSIAVDWIWRGARLPPRSTPPASAARRKSSASSKNCRWAMRFGRSASPRWWCC